MIDTHAHIEKIPTDLTEIDKLQSVILSSANLETAKMNLQIASEQSMVYAAIGVHPLEIGKIDEQINELDKLAEENPQVIAIGECGLDYSQEVDKKKQEILFRGQIAVSLKHQKPLIIHSREAADETLEILKSYKKLRGVVHCYTGGKKRIKRYLELDGEWYFGIDGNLTYEEGLVEVVKEIPKDRLLLETDSPELAPAPHRGERNQPNWVEFVYRKTAEIWGMSFEETEKIIDTNAKRLFEIK